MLGIIWETFWKHYGNSLMSGYLKKVHMTFETVKSWFLCVVFFRGSSTLVASDLKVAQLISFWSSVFGCAFCCPWQLSGGNNGFLLFRGTGGHH